MGDFNTVTKQTRVDFRPSSFNNKHNQQHPALLHFRTPPIVIDYSHEKTRLKALP